VSGANSEYPSEIVYKGEGRIGQTGRVGQHSHQKKNLASYAIHTLTHTHRRTINRPLEIFLSSSLPLPHFWCD